MPSTDSDDYRLRFVLAGQQHCDYFLAPIAQPRGKSVLVAGCGAGTEMLWCLRRGAREVVGIDIAAQSPAALEAAVDGLRLRPQGTFSIHRLPVEAAARLGRRFDLVLSNNVFEHVGDPVRALAGCAAAVTPGAGRIAIFTDPLFYSSAGSHLPVEPWEHLWRDWGVLRRRLLATLAPDHPLRRMDLAAYLDREITLNRMRLIDFVAAVRASDLVLHDLRLVRDRHLAAFGTYQERLATAPGAAALSPMDLTVEGVAAVLARVERPAPTRAAAAPRRPARPGAAAGAAAPGRRRGNGAEAAAAEALAREVEALRGLLSAVEASWSFRLGRLATAPLRWLRHHVEPPAQGSRFLHPAAAGRGHRRTLGHPAR